MWMEQGGVGRGAGVRTEGGGDWGLQQLGVERVLLVDTPKATSANFTQPKWGHDILRRAFRHGH